MKSIVMRTAVAVATAAFCFTKAQVGSAAANVGTRAGHYCA